MTHPLEPTYYPYATHLVENVLKPICSEHGGIGRSLLVSPIKYTDELDIRSVVAQMPAYHKVLLNPKLEMQYHLSGYGQYFEEALIRLAGEVIERYALLVAQHTLSDQIRYASYDEISRDNAVVPFEYLRLFSESDYQKLNRGQYRGLRPLERRDVVGWVRCASLFRPGTDVFVPAQMLFVGYKVSRENDEVPFSPGFSTGTAAHTSLEKALQNALLEFIEIDALMLHWYSKVKARAVTIDSLAAAALVPNLLAKESHYEVLALDLRILEKVSAHVMGSVIINKRDERPLIVLGAQGHLDPLRAFYRSLMEAIAIAFLGIYGPLYLPREYLAKGGDDFTDLDRNVAFYATPENAELKRSIVHRLVGDRLVLSGMKSFATNDVRSDTVRLVRQLAAHSQYGAYLDVTPPESRRHGWHVVRVFLPELVTMCVPGVPYSNHPRMQRYGGICNEFPHPLP